ncbi:hypothetical protein GDO81_020041 [Engystomops pustulosus]|uniref:Uncharacterized protein n=1 Tax=Engystomops pustulosus TaxID=76066 RepID=A0AAV6YSF3_ENGPU|nr:hypothetical protein GDO81_020041 [Engystomops pustulosus]
MVAAMRKSAESMERGEGVCLTCTFSLCNYPIVDGKCLSSEASLIAGEKLLNSSERSMIRVTNLIAKGLKIACPTKYKKKFK